MERFTGPDASFLYMETPNVHMHTLKVAVIDLPFEVPYTEVFDMDSDGRPRLVAGTGHAGGGPSEAILCETLWSLRPAEGGQALR